MSEFLDGTELYPSSRPLKIGDNVAIFGYPIAPQKTPVHDYGNGYETVKTSFYKLFWGYDSLVASLGTVTEIGEGIVATSSCTTKRMCGGPVVCLEDGESLFCGIHVGTQGIVSGEGRTTVATTANFFLATTSPQFVLFYIQTPH